MEGGNKPSPSGLSWPYGHWFMKGPGEYTLQLSSAEREIKNRYAAKATVTLTYRFWSTWDHPSKEYYKGIVVLEIFKTRYAINNQKGSLIAPLTAYGWNMLQILANRVSTAWTYWEIKSNNHVCNLKTVLNMEWPTRSLVSRINTCIPATFTGLLSAGFQNGIVQSRLWDRLKRLMDLLSVAVCRVAFAEPTADTAHRIWLIVSVFRNVLNYFLVQAIQVAHWCFLWSSERKLIRVLPIHPFRDELALQLTPRIVLLNMLNSSKAVFKQ